MLPLRWAPRLPACSRVHDAQHNFPRAITWYRAALRADPFNVEASPGCSPAAPSRQQRRAGYLPDQLLAQGRPQAQLPA